MPPVILLFFLALGALTPAWAQFGRYHETWYPHHNFTLSGGVGRPRGDIAGALTDAGGIGIGYGYRFARNFQADIGLETFFGAAGINDFLQTGIGAERIRDRQYLIPFGGRAVVPLRSERVVFSAGGGGAFLRYGENLHQPSNFYRIDCPVCTSRNGWAYYGLLNLATAIDRGQHIRLGFTGKVYRGYTNGDPIGGVPGIRTNDHWIVLMGDLGFSF